MRRVVVKVLNRDGSVYRENTYPAEDLGIMGDDWDEKDVDSALELLQESMPAAFALEDGSIGKYGFEIISEE